MWRRLDWEMGVMITILLVGCSLVPNEIPAESPPEPKPTPVLCTPLPDEMTFQVTPFSSTSAEIVMTGLQAGEIPIIIVEAMVPGGGTRLEITPGQPVDVTGQFNVLVSGISLPQGVGPSPEWSVLVIHAQGVACATLTLP